MVKYNAQELDFVFRALADNTRRVMLQSLSKCSQTAAQLAEPHAISLPAVSKHLKILERARLVERRIQGRTHEFKLNPVQLRLADSWIQKQQKFWEQSLQKLEDYLETDGGDKNA